MSTIFSKRYKKILKDKKINVSIPIKARKRILQMMDRFNYPTGSINNFGYHINSTLVQDVVDTLKYEHGIDYFEIYSESEDNKKEKVEDLSFILRGTYPPYVFDAIEIFYDRLTPDEQSNFQFEINRIFDDYDMAWRMANGKIFQIDSTFIEKYIKEKTFELLKQSGFEGALDEFEKAQIYFQQGEYKECIYYSNKSLESTIKTILGKKKEKQGRLVRELIDSGLIPEYHERFIKSFEENILRSVMDMRNQELGVGHGQGPEINEVPKSYAELALNLTAVLIKFIIDRYLEMGSGNLKEGEMNNSQDSELDEDIDTPF